jgi:hypothetical protein
VLRLQKHRSHLRGNYARFNRWEDQGFQSWFSAIQPLPAYVGLIGCLTTVIILNSASMWNGEGIMIKILTLYFGVRRLFSFFPLRPLSPL